MCNRKQITPKFRNVKITKASSYTVREINLKKKTEVLFANLYWNVDFVQNEDFEIDLEIQNVATNQVTIPSYVTMLPRYLNLGEPNLLISWKLRIATLRFYILFYWYSVLQSGSFLQYSYLEIFEIYSHQFVMILSLREKCLNTKLFLARIFLYLDWIRRFTP